MSIEQTTDFSAFDRQIKEAFDELAVEQALMAAGFKIAELASEEEPKMPILYGNLIGTQQVFTRAEQMQYGDGDAGQIDRSGQTDYEVRTQATMPYAERLHEEEDWKPGPISEQKGGVGPFFYRAKLTRFKKEIEDAFLTEYRRAKR